MKYKFTGEIKQLSSGVIVERIKRISDGLLGGWIENESNLSKYGHCFVYGNARIYGNAVVYGNADVSKTPFSVNRTDGYTFIICPDKDNVPVIIAGCRYFTIPEAKKHWIESRGKTLLGVETMAIIRYPEEMYNYEDENREID